MDGRSGSEVVQLALRAPRVVVLFRADERWQDWARLALQTVSETWGGSCFVLMPYDPVTGLVPAVLLPLAIAYDPDHVVITSPAIRDWVALAPGQVDLGDATVEELGAHAYRDPAAEAAREQVVRVCSVLRRPPAGLGEEPAVRGRESVVDARVTPTAGGLTRVPDHMGTSAVLAVSPNWTGPAALWAAVRAGVPARPDPYLRTQPDDDVLYAWAVLPSLLAPPQELLRQPSMELSVLAAGRPTWFESVDPAFTFFHEGITPPSSVIVFGDTATDFAMAMLYDRLTGYGLWAPAALDLTDAACWSALRGYDHVLRVIRDGGRESYATSGSLTPEDLQQRFDHLRTYTSTGPVRAGELQAPVRQESLRLGVPAVRASLRSLFLREGLNERRSVPILIEDTGRRVLQTGLMTPLPAVQQRVYPLESPAFPYWYVDVVIEADPTPKGRDLPGASVAVLPKQFAEAAVRRSRAGYTFHAANPGLVIGSTVADRLARAQLIVPPMREWVETVATAAGLQARPSRPGQHGHLLAQRLGSREALIDLVSSRGALLLPFAYRDPKHPRPTLPAAHGDTLNKTEDVLTLAGIQAAAPDLGLGQIRDTLDLLVEADLLWPGLTLSCRDCNTVAHIRLGQLGNTYRCPRCAALNTLTHHRWDNHGNPADPTWYYDLHPIFRQLLHDHGDVPLLAAAALRSRALSYTDIAEMEFIQIGETRPAFEIDLIAHLDDRLLIVEAKSSNSFKNSRDRVASVKKLLAAADLLQADRLVLATTAPGGWSSTDVTFANAEVTHRTGVRALDIEALTLSG